MFTAELFQGDIPVLLTYQLSSNVSIYLIENSASLRL